MIKDIQILEYKGFKNLKLDNLSQINLISGKNNVGKTALLEALFIYDDIAYSFENVHTFSNIDTFLSIANTRNISEKRLKNYLQDLHYKVEDLDIQYKSKYQLNELEEVEIKQLNQDYRGFIVGYKNDKMGIIPTSKTIEYEEGFFTKYIDSSKPNNERLVELYSTIQSKGIQHKFLNYLQLLDEDIVWLEPQLLEDEMLLRINLKNPERSLVSSELGEGTNRYIEILCSLLSNSQGRVFIDEIENGIHYSKLYDIWKAIIEVVKEEEIQLFVTTHDLESIEALGRASEDMNFKEISSIKLAKDTENKIYPIIRNYNSFSATVNSGMDIR
ncbi:MAG: Unknown protein [uncultured Sulfurovum sp.]|uniref:ATPase AAA-type core domain-containing protein n=1 Tax=uncultured Sulfurovum sp. TaxID=269237 RepID=A0A6S6T3I6_9BACT|nr:MAG: Unknown protein [uncultured Sulfurovum sp.]